MHKKDKVFAHPRISDRLRVIMSAKTPDRIILWSPSDFAVLHCEEDAKKWLNKLLLLLNGKHDLAHIIKSLRKYVQAKEVRAIISELYEKGLLENAAEEVQYRWRFSEDELERYTDQIRFFSHFAIKPRQSIVPRFPLPIPQNKYDVQARLKDASVLVVGCGIIGSRIVKALALCGVGRIIGLDNGKVHKTDTYKDSWYTTKELGQPYGTVLGELVRQVNPHVTFEHVQPRILSRKTLAPLLKKVNIAVLSLDEINVDLYEDFNIACLEQGTVWTSCRIQGFEVEIGPTVIPRETPCYKCLELRNKGNLPSYEYLILEDYLHKSRLKLETLNMIPVVDLTALEVIKTLTYFTSPTTYGRVFSFNLLSFSSHLHPILKLPRCPHCGTFGIKAKPRLKTFQVQEEA